MMRKNLIVIATLAFGLVLTANTFGQSSSSVSKKNKPNANAGFFDEYETGGNSVRSGNVRATATLSPQVEQKTTGHTQSSSNFGPRVAPSVDQSNALWQLIESVRSPSNNRSNLGDTGTHEVGHKQRKRGSN